MFVLGTAAFAVSSAVKKRLESESFRAAFLLPDYFTVTAHSGCNGKDPDKLESLAEAINSGADIMEIDLLDNEKGELILAHDYIEGKTYIPFEEALDFIKENSDKIKINIDLKRSHVSYAADEAVSKRGMSDRCFFTGVNEDDVPLIAPTVSLPYYLNIHPTLAERNSEEYWVSMASKISMLGAVGANCKYTQISKKGVEILRKNSLLVSVFTPDSPTQLNFALTLSPDNITTRNPGLILEKRRIKEL